MSNPMVATPAHIPEKPAWSTDRKVDDDVDTWGAVVVTDTRDLELGKFHGFITRVAFLDYEEHPVEVAARWSTAPQEQEEFYIDVTDIPALIAYLQTAVQIIEAAK